MLTLNENPRVKDDLVEIIFRASSYFPEDSWEVVNYLSKVEAERQLEIRSRDELMGPS